MNDDTVIVRRISRFVFINGDGETTIDTGFREENPVTVGELKKAMDWVRLVTSDPEGTA